MSWIPGDADLFGLFGPDALRRELMAKHKIPITLKRDQNLPQEARGDVPMYDASTGPAALSMLPQVSAAQQNAAASPPSTPQPVLPKVAAKSGYGAGAAAPAAAAPGSHLDAELANQRAQRDKLQEDPDYGPLKEQMRGRAFDSGNAMIGSMLAGIGPDWTQGMALPMAQRAMKAAEPMKVEGGEIDIEGNVRIDPGFKRTQQLEFIQKRINELEIAKGRELDSARHDALLREQIALRRQAAGIAAQQRADELAWKKELSKQEQWKPIPDMPGYVFDGKTGEVKKLQIGTGIDGEQPMPKLTDSQGRATAYGMRMRQASDIIDKVGMDYSPMGVATRTGASSIPYAGPLLGGAVNWMVSANTQKAEQAQRNFINAVLRRESGAVINADEFANAKQQYFPQPLDDPQTIAQKRENREMAIRGLQIEAGPGRRFINDPYGKESRALLGLKPGEAGSGAPGDPYLLE